MNVGESIGIALDSIRGNKLRSFLTMLGVVIGVAAMQTMVALIEGAKQNTMEQLQGLGAQSIYVFGQEFDPEEAPETEWRGHSKGIRISDVQALAQLEGVKDARPQIMGLRLPVTAGDESYEAEIAGVSPREEDTTNIEVVAGRFFVPSDVDIFAKVAVLGAEVKTELFGEDSPLGETVTINQNAYEVIGFLKARGGQGRGDDVDRRVYVPFTTAQKRLLGSDQVPAIVVEAYDGIDLNELTGRIKTEMKALHSNVEDFDTISQLAILEAVQQIMLIFQIILGGVGGLSLLVGGIGIMNIMLVTVTERTREIGIRKAIGAKKRDILAQFVVESGVLAGCGGIIGILFGLMLTSAFGSLNEDIPFHVPLWAMLFSFGFAFAVGAFFGIYPAIRAANLDPIEALRYE
jgi:putative ABC transport system permease protein